MVFLRCLRLNRSCWRVIGVRGLATRAPPFPVLRDTLDPACLQLQAGKQKAEEFIHQLKQVNAVCLAGGGEKGIEVHVKKNKKLLVRDKLRLLLDDDDDDVLELCLQAGLGMEYGDVPAASTITVVGRIQGQYCMVISNDGTVKGGTSYPISVTKALRAQDVVIMNHLPAVQIVDTGGAFLPLQSEIFPDKKHGGRSFYNLSVISAAGNSQIAVVCGMCTAGGAYQPAMCEDLVMVDQLATIYLGGPPLVKAATGEEVSAQELGGAELHCSVSGVSDYFAETEDEGFAVARDAVASLNLQPVPPAPHQPHHPTLDPSLLDALCGGESISRQQVYGVIARLVDGGRFREFKQKYGTSLTTGYALLEGWCVGVVANAGPLTHQDGLKGSHFIQICQQRQIPLIFLQNSGSLEEYEATCHSLGQDDLHQAMKGRGAMMAALSCATVPKVTINIGNCHADDNYTMCGPSFCPSFIFSWPNTTVTHTMNPPVLPLHTEPPPEGNKKASKPKKQLSAFSFPMGSALYQASRCLTDGVVIPSQTRQVVAQCLRISKQKDYLTSGTKAFPVFRL